MKNCNITYRKHCLLCFFVYTVKNCKKILIEVKDKIFLKNRKNIFFI